ncbi:hypothetical protein [Bernardetia sp.]|uniref:hypothetical protein n=1 Tax=Bernardetia sp. TaxID=1937974 RepID=UPI0025BFD597|nr:hypothetical protein [Bernardetia sp.]
MKSLKEKFGKFALSQKETRNLVGGDVTTPPIDAHVDYSHGGTHCCDYRDRDGNIYTNCGVRPTPESIRCYYVY